MQHIHTSQRNNDNHAWLREVLLKINSTYFGNALQANVAIDVPGPSSFAKTGLGVSSSPVPAATYDPSGQVFIVHPYLLERRAPRYVIEVLLIHAACQHNHVLTRKCHPRIVRAVDWLEKRGFPADGMMPCV